MTHCENFQSQLLDYLYDVLDGDERRALDDHLTVCQPCQAALQAAQGHRRLLAAAARSAFPTVRFETPPVDTSVQDEQPRALSFPRARWAGWAAAAAIFLLVSGLGIPAGVWAWKQRELQMQADAVRAEHDQMKLMAKNFARQQQDRRQRLTEEAEAIQEAERKTQIAYNERVNHLQEAINQQQLQISVTGPAALQPGAPNNYQIQILDLNGRPAQADLTMLVRDKERKQVHKKDVSDARGVYTLTLPAGLPLAADGQLALEILARRPNGPATQLSAELPLAAPLYVTHLTTDKPMYQPGETVRFRSLTLERFSLRPPQDYFQVVYTITNPLGAEIFRHQGATMLADPNRSDALVTLGPDQKPVRGVGAGEFVINPDLPGGEYTLTVKEANERFPEQQRKFLVNKYQKDRLLKELDFNRKSYGPGDEVMAACKVKRAEGGAVITHQPVTVTVNVDGKTYGADGKATGSSFLLRTDAEGKVNVRFKLPTAIDQGRATLSVVFSDGGSTEPLAKPIPIVLKKLNVDFFPEGGDLIAGAPNRVYFQVRSTLDKAADLAGRIVDEDGKVVVAAVQTLNDDKEPGVNQGMGAFTFTPLTGKKYELKIDTPRGIEGRYELPKVQGVGVVLHVASAVVLPGEPLGITLHNSGETRGLLVGAYCRGRLIDHTTVSAPANEAVEVRLPLKDAPGGVYRVTVFEQTSQTLRPLAERLVYRMPSEQLNLAVKPAKDRYVPGDPVTLSVQTTTEKQTPTPAILMMAVVDKSVLTMADEKTFRSMPTHFFLTTEVRKPEDLEYADFLLGKHSKAAPALDLLLGTQGWRRFAEQNPDKFKQEQRAEADRLLVLMGQTPKPAGDLVQRAQQQAYEDFVAQSQNLAERRKQAQQAWTAVAQEDGQRLIHAQAEADAQRRYLVAVAALDLHRGLLDRFRTVGLWLVLPLLLAGAGVCLILAILRHLPRAMPYYAVSAVCMLLVLVGAALLHWGDPSGGTQRAWMPVATDLGNAPTDAVAPPAMLADQARPEGLLFEARTAGTMPVAPDMAGGGGPGLPQPLLPQAGPGGIGGARGPRPGFGAPAAGQPVPMPAMPAAPAPRMKMERGMVLAEGKGEAKGPAAEMLNRRKLDERLDAPGRDLQRRAVDGRPPAADRAAALAKLPAEQAKKAMPDARRLRGDLRGGFGVGAGGRAGDAKDKELERPSMLYAREYAHKRQSSATPEVRRDFTETLYWHPVLVLPEGNGQVTFDLCDSVTTFQVAAVGHTLDGRMGALTTTVEARKPFTLEPRLPLEVTADDLIDIPVSVANNTSQQTTAVVRAEGQALKLLKGQATEELPLGADQRKRLVYRFQPSIVEGAAQLYLDGSIPGFEGDKVLHTFQVVPQGFPVIGSKSDMLEKSAQEVVELPKDWLKGTLKARVEVYPSTLADLQKGLAALLREPNGCFEQTSTSNYPNLLILDYLKETDQALPEVEKRARELLARGYQRLTAYECPYDGKGRNGFEWFGQQNNAHEALTAYGLMQFRDMSRVQEVDQAMVERTKQWLLARKDGKGGFQRNPRALDTFGRAPEDITNAYIIWALTESSKEDDVTKELDRLFEQAKTSKDPYFLSLVANSLLNRNRTEDGCALLKTVAEAAKPDGHLEAARTSITGSGGRDLQIETTALAVFGWLKANRPADFNKPVQAAVKWIGQQRGGRGGFGSTQSTILALKALIAFAKANKKTPEGGELTLFVGEQKVAELKFPAGASEALTLELPAAEQHLKAGKNAVRVEITGKNVFPYTLSWSYQTLQPISAAQCPVKLEATLAKTTLQEGDTVRLTAKVTNVSGKGQGMAVAILGLPAGLSVPEDMKQLKNHALIPTDGSRPLVGAFEIRGRELVLYWRDLAPDQKIEVPIDLVCRVPGEYSGPASRAYLYYNADHKHWVEPLKVAIAAKAE